MNDEHDGATHATTRHRRGAVARMADCPRVGRGVLPRARWRSVRRTQPTQRPIRCVLDT